MVLPADLTRALDAAATTPRLLVASDFDGTLAPIVNDPADARPCPSRPTPSSRLPQLPSTTVALVSGRALAVLRELSGMPVEVHLVGSHGAEFDTGFAHGIDENLLAQIIAELDAIAAGRPGVDRRDQARQRRASRAQRRRRRRRGRVGGGARGVRAWDAHTTEGKAVWSSPSSSPTRVRRSTLCAIRPLRRQWSSSATTSPTRRPSAECATPTSGQGRTGRHGGGFPRRLAG